MTGVTASNTIEQYYAEMEAERAHAEDEYFRARPNLQRSRPEEELFRAGFERAFRRLWKPPAPVSGEKQGVEGLILIGQEFIWHPNDPYSRCHVRVTRIEAFVGRESRIYTQILDGPHANREPVWNEESLFRKACVRVEHQ